MDKPNCYECVHRRIVPGDTHSSCAHPEVGEQDIFTIMGMALSGKFTELKTKLGVTGNPHGIKHGWFLWPANFDPVWLLSCNGFEKKKIG